MQREVNPRQSFSAVLSEMKQQVQDFVQTRFTILQGELQEKVRALQVAAPLAAVGVLLLLIAYLLFTFAITAVVFVFLPESVFRWSLAFLAVSVLWCVLGGIATYFAKRELEMKNLLPKRTVEVLKEDRVWIQSEVRQRG